MSIDDALAPTIATDHIPAPRTRWAAIVWGLVFAALAAAGVWLLDETRRDDIADWILAQTPSSITATALLTVGILILITGAIGLIRSLQKRWTSPS